MAGSAAHGRDDTSGPVQKRRQLGGCVPGRQNGSVGYCRRDGPFYAQHLSAGRARAGRHATREQHAMARDVRCGDWRLTRGVTRRIIWPKRAGLHYVKLP